MTYVFDDELKYKYQNYNQDDLDEALIDACRNGEFYVVYYLFTSSDLSCYPNIHKNNDEALQIACQRGHLEIVKYLLTCPDLKEHADIHADGDEALLLACKEGHLDVVKYLLTSPDLEDHADIHADAGFRWACKNGHLEVVKYLLTSSELTEHADIHAGEDSGFIWVCQKSYLDVAQYLLSFNGKQCIDFQNKYYNLDWAIENQYNEIIFVMMKNLKQNNILHYIECLPKIEAYNKELYEQVKNIEVEGLEVNPQETSLFV